MLVTDPVIFFTKNKPNSPGLTYKLRKLKRGKEEEQWRETRSTFGCWQKALVGLFLLCLVWADSILGLCREQKRKWCWFDELNSFDVLVIILEVEWVCYWRDVDTITCVLEVFSIFLLFGSVVKFFMDLGFMKKNVCGCVRLNE